jgi:S-adenosylmethionine decarboxylase
MQIGTEYLIDATGCSAEALRDGNLLRSLCERVLGDLDLRALGAGIWHQFPSPGGLTGFYLLTESHLACHTYPEHGVATFNLYCCRTRPRWDWERHLRDALGATAVSVRALPRGPSGPGGEA